MTRKFVEMNFSEKKKNSSLNVRDARSSASLKTEVSWKSNWNWKKKPFSFKITSFVEKTHSTRCDSEELQKNTKCLYSCCDNSSVCLSLSFLNIFSSQQSHSFSKLSEWLCIFTVWPSLASKSNPGHSYTRSQRLFTSES